MRKLLSAAIVATTALVLPTLPNVAHGAFIGNDLLIEWHWSSLGSIYATETNTVDGGIEFTERADGPNIDIGSSTIDFFGADGGVFVPASFNGFVFTDISNTIVDFLGVSISSQTGYSGFDLSDVNVTANRIEVNFADVGPITDPNQVQLTVRFGDEGAVSEPATLALVGLGLAGLGYHRKRKAA